MPRSVSFRSDAPEVRRYRRSAFNGAKQLAAAQAPNRRILILLAVLALALVASLAVIVGVHMQPESSPQFTLPTATATHPASH